MVLNITSSLTIFLPKYPGFTLALNVFLFTLAEKHDSRMEVRIKYVSNDKK